MAEADTLIRPLGQDASLYERDFYAWATGQAELIRSGRLSELDRDNLVEELEALGRSEKNEIASRVEVILLHLLKWEFQPAYRSRSWSVTIENQRERLLARLDENPSLRRYPEDLLAQAYRRARREAVRETGFALKTFPSTCPYGVSQVVDADFLPGAIGEDRE